MEINDIFNGISIQLRASFGAGYTIYMDEVPQGFKRPSFLIQLLSMDHVREVKGRWYVAPLFNVQYFSDKGKRDLANHSLQVQQALNIITLTNTHQILAKGMNSEMVDDVLHNFMRFDFYLTMDEAKDYMETLRLRTNGVINVV